MTEKLINCALHNTVHYLKFRSIFENKHILVMSYIEYVLPYSFPIIETNSKNLGTI